MLHVLTRGAQVTGVAVMSLGVTWIAVSLRFYVRLRILRFVGREDWLTIAAMVCMTTLCALLLRTEDYGLGAHIHSIPPEDAQIGLKHIFFSELLYVLTTAVTKLSIGVYFLRLSSKRYQIRIIWTTLAIVMLFSTMYFFFLLFQCTPMNHFWAQFNDGGSSGTCLGRHTLANVTYAHAAMSALTDWAFGLLPIAFVWNMHMNPRTKASVVLILSLGFFASSATIVRIIYIRQLELTTDYSWFGINLVKWSMVEPAIAITAAAFATLRPLFKNAFVFARKQFDSTIDEERASAESHLRAKDYSVEFAEMLGLSRVGVTTEITAGGSEAEKGRLRAGKRLSMIGSRLLQSMQGIGGTNGPLGLGALGSTQEGNESQTELRRAKTGEGDGLDWGHGITKTTVIEYER